MKKLTPFDLGKIIAPTQDGNGGQILKYLAGEENRAGSGYGLDLLIGKVCEDTKEDDPLQQCADNLVYVAHQVNAALRAIKAALEARR